MRWTAVAALGMAVCGVLAIESGSFGQSGSYTSVYVADIINGYVPDGELIETSGHIWFQEAGALLNVNAPSAQVPLRIDVSAIPADQRTQWSACAASRGSFLGGCEAVVRGKTGAVEGERGIFALDIQIQAREP